MREIHRDTLLHQIDTPGGVQENPSLTENPAGDRGPAGEKTFLDWNNEPIPPFGEDGVQPPATESEGNPVEPAPAKTSTDEPPPDAEPAPKEEKPPQTADPGKDPDSPGDLPGEEIEDKDVEGILAKYNHQPAALAKANKHQARLLTAKGEEAKKLRQELADMYELVDANFETDDKGSRQLRSDAALRRLQEGGAAPPMVDEQAIRAQVNDNYRRYLRESLAIDEVDEALERSKERIEADVQNEIARQTDNVNKHRANEQAKAAMVLQEHFRDNPDDSKQMKQIQSWYNRFPAEWRHLLILNNWLPVHDVARHVKATNELGDAVREAYKKGIDAGRNSLTPSDGSRPSSGVTTPRTGEPPGGPDGELKASILKAGVLESFFGD
jgi:hypothetical protein